MTTSTATQQLITAIGSLQGSASNAALDVINDLATSKGADIESNDVWLTILKTKRADVAEILFDAGVSPDKKIFGLNTRRMPDPSIGAPLVLAAIELRAGNVACMAIDRDCDIGLKGNWVINLMEFVDSKSDRFDSTEKQKVKQKLFDKGLYPSVKASESSVINSVGMQLLNKSILEKRYKAAGAYQGH